MKAVLFDGKGGPEMVRFGERPIRRRRAARCSCACAPRP